jgi:type IV pilus assembly protein PilM
MEVMLAAARREKVEDRVAIAEAAGLTATVMDIESYAARAALERASCRRPARTRSSRCSRSAPITHVSMLLNGDTVYEREQPFGGNR